MKKVDITTYDDIKHARDGELVLAHSNPFTLSFDGETWEFDLSSESVEEIREYLKPYVVYGRKITPRRHKRATPVIESNAVSRRDLRLAQRIFAQREGIVIPKDKAGWKYTEELERKWEAYEKTHPDAILQLLRSASGG